MAGVSMLCLFRLILGPLLLLAALVPWGRSADAAEESSGAASPVSSTGLLPIFGVGIDFEALPGKGADAKPDEAVESVQALWSSHLEGAGFNVVQIAVDVGELGDKGAGRLAALCRWAESRNVRLAPTLIGAPPGRPLPDDFPDRAAAFAAKVIENVGRDGEPTAYAQIMFYQLERPLNHPVHHGPMEPSAAADLLARTLDKLRAAEQAALAGTSLQATPVLVPASFDYELIVHGGIVNVELTDEMFEEAYASLHDYVIAVTNAAPVDVVALEWYPGSVSSGAVDRFPDAVERLQTDLPGKIVLVGTGFSTASGGEEDQSRFYTQTFNNLCDVRTNQGVESSFAGILWRTAMDRRDGAPAPPSSETPNEMESWDWTERAEEVSRMWNEPGSESKQMKWWYGNVESRFGFLSPGAGGSKPANEKATYQLLARLKSSLAVAAAATGASDIAEELAGGEGGKGVGGAVKERLQSALFGMLDAWVSKTAENLVSGGSGGDEGAPPPPEPPPLADLQIVGLGELDAAPKVGSATPLSVTLFNAGSASATNVVLYLREGASTDLAFSSPTSLSQGGSVTVDLPWTPSRPGNFHDVALDAYCDNEQDPTTNHADLGDIMVEAAPSGGGHGAPGGYALNPALLGAVKGSLLTKTAPGFARIDAIRSITPTPIMSTRSGGAPSGGSATMELRSASAPIQPISLAFSISNPFGHDFSAVKGTLKIDGKTIASKDIGRLLPRQRRTVTFGTWTPPKTGTYDVEIQMSGKDPRNRTLTSTATDKVVVGSSAPSVATRSLLPAGGATAGGSSTRAITPLIRTGGAAKSGTPAMTMRSLLVRSGAKSKPASYLGLTANSIIVRPLPVTIGKPVEVSVRLYNSGRSIVSKAKVEVFVGREKLGETKIDVAVARSVIARGFKNWNPKPGRHSLRVVVSSGSRRGEAVKPISVTPPHAVGKGGVAALVGRGALTAPKLAIGPTDILMTPAVPAAGTSVALSARVRNTGTATASGVRAELLVDEIRLGSATGDIAAGKERIFTFPKWKAVSGSHTFVCRVASGTLRTETTRNVSVGAVALKMLTTTTATTATKATLLLAKPDLQILTTDIRFSPTSPRAGTTVTISITVRNIGKATATGGSVLGVLQVDGKEVARRQFAAALAAGGSTTLSWPVTTPTGKQLSVTATAKATNDARADNNVARGVASVAVTIPYVPRLVVPTK